MKTKILIRLFATSLVICIVFEAIAPVSAQMTVSDQGENIQPTAVPVESTVPQTAGIDPTVVDPVPPGPAFTPDASVPMPRPSKPRFDRFNRWMKVLNEFFTKGNWLNGGPDDLLQYAMHNNKFLLVFIYNKFNF